MAGDSFNSAGADASTGIMSFMAALEAKRRQDKLDAMTAQQQQFDQQMHLRDMTLKESKEQREAEQHKADLAERAAQHGDAAAKLAEDIQAKKQDEFKKSISNMGPGDYPDSQQVQTAQSLGMGNMFPQPSVQQQSLPGVVAPNAPQVQPGIRVAPQPNEPPAQMGLTGAADPGVRPFPGTYEQRHKLADEQALDTYAKSLPAGSAARQVVEAKQHGVTLTAGDLKVDNPASDNAGVFRQSPRDGTVERHVDNQWVPWSGDVPKTAHWITVPPPKDTSVGDALHQDRIDRDLRAAKDKATVEFNTEAKPFLDRIDRANKMNDSLKAHSDIADATIAEQLVTLTAGGAGSGVRISQPMIDQVLHKTNTVWEDLELRLRKWDKASPEDKARPSKFFTDTQRTAIHDLGQLYLASAQAQHAKILDYQSKIDDATNFDDIRHLRTAAKRDIFDSSAKSDEATSAPAAPTMLPPGVTVRKVR